MNLKEAYLRMCPLPLLLVELEWGARPPLPPQLEFPIPFSLKQLCRACALALSLLMLASAQQMKILFRLIQL